MGWQSLVRFLIPCADRFYDFLEEQGRLAAEGAKAMAMFLTGAAKAEDVRAAVQAVEHKGDAVVHEMEETLATPSIART